MMIPLKQQLIVIEDIKKTSKEQHEEISKELGERIGKVEKKVESINQFKWKAVGAIAIVAFLTGIIPTVSLFLTPYTSPATIEKAK